MRILLLALAALLASSAPAIAAPIPNFSFSPTTPTVGEIVTFLPGTTPDADPLTTADWDFQNDTIPDVVNVPALQAVTHSYPEAGIFQVRMLVRDAGGDVVNVVKPIRVNAPPVAQFSVSPRTPVAGQEVFFESFSYDPGGSPPALAWDIDGDGFDDGTGATATHTFTTPGAHTVQLRATDADGVSNIATRTVNVGPAPADPLPVAQFAVSPVEPEVGEQVALRSFSYDPNGDLSSQRWDLDGDGDFDESVHGKTAFTVFSTAGERIVRLEARDSRGGVQTETQTIVVKPQSDDMFTSSGLKLMNPFPVVRLAGSVYPRGVRVRTLEAKAPRRSSVTVLCAGKSCPSKKIVKTAKRKPVRFRSMSRFLREGTILSVSIRRSGQIGKYTRWLIRGGKLPKRRDLCLYPNRRKAARCPSD